MAKAKAPKAKMGRTVISGVQVRLGLATISGNLCAVRKSESSSKPTVNGEKVTVESACPTHYDVDASFARLKRVYVCEDDETHGPFGQGDALKAVGGKVIASADEYLSAGKEDEEDNPITDMQLVPHYADEVEQYTIFTGAAYAFSPSVENPVYAVMLHQISGDGSMVLDDGRRAVLLGEVLQRGKKHLFQLRTWNGQLVMQEVARPEDMYEMDAREADVDERFEAMFRQLVEATVEDFDPATYEDTARKRLEEFVNARSGDTAPELEVLTGGQSETLKAVGSDAMLAMLSASVEAARARKAS